MRKFAEKNEKNINQIVIGIISAMVKMKGKNSDVKRKRVIKVTDGEVQGCLVKEISPIEEKET